MTEFCSREKSKLRHLPLTVGVPSSREDSPDTVYEGIGVTEDSENPQLVHRWTHDASIVCLAAAPKKGLLFCGTQDSCILVFDLQTYQKKACLVAHTGSVLCLTVSEDENILFSGGSDSLVKVWDVLALTETHTIYSLVDIGDIFSITWVQSLHTVVFGAQNASILYAHLRIIPKDDPSFLPSNRFDKFFDSVGPGGHHQKKKTQRSMSMPSESSRLIEVPDSNIITYAHNGYVYAMLSTSRERNPEMFATIPDVYHNIIVSAGGDGMVHIWKVDENGMALLHTLDNDESVLSLDCQESFLYCGLADGQVKVWDLSTLQHIRTFDSDEGDTSAIAIHFDCLFKGTPRGVTKWKFKGEQRTEWVAHDKTVLSIKTMKRGGSYYLLTAGLDNSATLWLIDAISIFEDELGLESKCDSSLDNQSMLRVLSQLVAFRTVSKNPELYIDQSRQCASFLRSFFKNMGADTAQLIPVKDANPIVFACFKACRPPADRTTRVLWYGHYDVIEADGSFWDSDPFTITASDGYLYGRGVTDNKGPMLAAVYAVAELVATNALSSDVCFLIEGEEECGSFGFQDAVLENKPLIGEIDWVMLSNSYWLDDKTPCLNYGLRGVISVAIEVSSDGPDKHSGVDGGVSREPTVDLINVLSKLTDDTGRVLIPGFYEPVKPITDTEREYYEKIAERTGNITADTLMARWRFPSFTVHTVSVSGPGNRTVIPRSAVASVSLRIVPSQDIDEVKKSLCGYLLDSFKRLKTDNNLKISVEHEAEPWLADINNEAYKILFDAVVAEWGVEPLFIREGGSIPSIRFLEKALDAPAAHVPCGQSSDNAHLNNERVRVTNLFKTRAIMKRTFENLS
ncbi:unnamed protein product [Kuraishia capsulata CBS 1993]|uniref:Peptidase M20 dimerisation domain-containing protein n=1 Tax=Kuraishia capsulata CBS 1993 TaxID=1382522 RepID=W6MFB4_9ASCO|nr:uncharacterized protein KUCA_T00000151001 [Kuraishia capsulata CBS 1993]CDK24191.1 unnamed protein product [Kuraishia capsulata CBS 1993]